MLVDAPGKYRMRNGKIASITFVGKTLLIGTRDGWGPIMCFWRTDGKASVKDLEREAQYDLVERMIENSQTA